MKKRVKIRYRRVFITFLILILIVSAIANLISKKEKNLKMENYEGKNISELIEFSNKNNLTVEKKYEYSDNIEKDIIIEQNINAGTKINNQKIIVKVSLGKFDKNVYIKNSVDESGRIPVMMYHGIVNIKDEETDYYGGNVDKDGYTRTIESFERDLELYYNEGFRMIRLIDLVDKKIDVELGYSPIVLTFDDGNVNNIKITGLDDKGNIIIDPSSAIGVLEKFKKRYPDFGVTATFFLNGGLFKQTEYNDKIMKWLVENGYDIGNHSYGHADFTSTDISGTQKEIGRMYNILKDKIGDNYVPIVALPFGSPYKKNHENFKYILNGEYEGIKYHTKSTLQVGWTSNVSPFSKSFDSEFIQRIRAYDDPTNESGVKRNIEMLKSTKYISDGDSKKIVVPIASLKWIDENNSLEIVSYERE